MLRLIAGALLFTVLAAAETPEQIRAILAERIDRGKKVVGIAVGVLDDSGTRVIGHGRLSKDRDKTPDGDTVFEIGSISKVFTSLALADMIERGEVKPDDPVEKYLPASVKVPSRNGKKITLLDLSMQVSGLPRMPNNFRPGDPQNPYMDYDAAKMYEFLNGYTLTREPGEQYEYSNLAVGLLGHALARRAGMSYEELLRKRVWEPLKMSSTTITLSADHKARLAMGHNAALQQVKNWDLDALAGAGAIRSTVNDMLKFLAAASGRTKSPLDAAFKRMLNVRRDAGGPDVKIAMGWHIFMQHSAEIVWHNGGTGGYRTFAGYTPANKKCVVVLTNTNFNSDDIGRHLLVPQWELQKIEPAAGAPSNNADNQAAARVDEIFQQWNKPDSPGAALAVIHRGKIVLEKGYGAANLEYDVPIKPETVFHVASVTKQFTAMALVLLEQENRLSLEEDIHKYLPELPRYGKAVTIRNLLQHTSGIRDQWQTLGIAGWRLDDVITQKQILRMLFHQKELNFDPGTRHLYSNGGYTLAAEIVARVSKKSFPEFCEERIFKPLGMMSTHMHDDHRKVVHDRAYSYEPRPGGFQASPLNYANAGATSLFTTAGDLAKWLDNFRDPKVGGPGAIGMLQDQAIVNGQRIDYALGVSVSDFRGVRMISHGGADAGYRSSVAYFPNQELGVVVLSNLATFNPGAISNRVAEIYLGDALKPAPPTSATPPARTYVTLDTAALDPLTGYYRLTDGRVLHVAREGSKLMAGPLGSPKSELKPLSAARFYAEPQRVELEFVSRPAGAMGLKFKQNDSIVEADRFELRTFEPKDVDRYTGAYWSDEVETQYTIFARDGRLFADHAHHGEIALTALSADEFRSPSWFMSEVKFERDASGRVTAMVLGGGRVTGIKFSKRP